MDQILLKTILLKIKEREEGNNMLPPKFYAMLRYFLFIALYLLGGQLSMGQSNFKKFESKTKFNPQNKKEIKKKSIQNIIDKSKSNKKDYFGRKTNNTAANKNRDKKYVNLNPETAFGPEIVTSFDFPDTSLSDLTKHMQKLTGINLILDKELKGKVSILAPTAITVGDAWKAYLTALNLNGYTLVKSGNFYKIVNARDIRYTPTKIYTGSYTPETENYVMRILPLKNIDSTEVSRSFRPFMSRYGRIINIKQTNTIIVQDTGSNINRLVRLIKFLDIPGHEETLQIIPIVESSAQEIAKLLDQIILKNKSSKKFSSSSRTFKNIKIGKIIPEPRTNSIIAMANKEGSSQLRKLIKKLDVKIQSNSTGLIHVYYLSHSDSEVIAKTLSEILTNLQASSKKQSSKRSFLSSKNSNSSPGLLSAEVKVSSDKSNNALVITAAPTDYITIKNVIKKLDIPRDQVYVEAMIMETQVSQGSAFGINLIGAYGSGNANRAGFTGGSGGASLMNMLQGNITSLGGLFIGGGLGKSIDIGPPGAEVKVNSVNGLISAIASQGNTNVLANPQILAIDNEEAVFEVGETIPVPERSTSNGVNTVSIKPQKVGLTLKITPKINKASRMIKLKIHQQSDDFSERSSKGVDGLATTTRLTETTVLVRDRDTIAMGGLMRDKISRSVSKVPLLGDIPILGWLFKNTEKTIVKVNMLFFITPRILDSNGVNSAKHLKEILNRRNIHLKNVSADGDPFKTTAKGLYEKATRQEAGVLYSQEDATRYQDLNRESDTFVGNTVDSTDEENDEGEIIEEGMNQNGVPTNEAIAPDDVQINNSSEQESQQINDASSQEASSVNNPYKHVPVDKKKMQFDLLDYSKIIQKISAKNTKY